MADPGKNEDLPKRKEDLPYGGDIGQAMRREDRKAVRMIMRWNRENPTIIEETPPPPLPAIAQQCSNQFDHISTERWSEDNQPNFFIRFYKPNLNDYLTSCYKYESIIQQFENPNNTYALWIPPHPNAVFDDNGNVIMPSGQVVQNGQPSLYERYYRMPDTGFYVSDRIVGTIEPNKTFLAIPLYKIRIGNTGGNYYIGDTHAQYPGFTVYMMFEEGIVINNAAIAGSKKAFMIENAYHYLYRLRTDEEAPVLSIPELNDNEALVRLNDQNPYPKLDRERLWQQADSISAGIYPSHIVLNFDIADEDFGNPAFGSVEDSELDFLEGSLQGDINLGNFSEDNNYVAVPYLGVPPYQEDTYLEQHDIDDPQGITNEIVTLLNIVDFPSIACEVSEFTNITGTEIGMLFLVFRKVAVVIKNNNYYALININSENLIDEVQENPELSMLKTPKEIYNFFNGNFPEPLKEIFNKGCHYYKTLPENSLYRIGTEMMIVFYRTFRDGIKVHLSINTNLEIDLAIVDDGYNTNYGFNNFVLDRWENLYPGEYYKASMKWLTYRFLATIDDGVFDYFKETYNIYIIRKSSHNKNRQLLQQSGINPDLNEIKCKNISIPMSNLVVSHENIALATLIYRKIEVIFNFGLEDIEIFTMLHRTGTQRDPRLSQVTFGELIVSEYDNYKNPVLVDDISTKDKELEKILNAACHYYNNLDQNDIKRKKINFIMAWNLFLGESENRFYFKLDNDGNIINYRFVDENDEWNVEVIGQMEMIDDMIDIQSTNLTYRALYQRYQLDSYFRERISDFSGMSQSDLI
jgi:hypothetical protein